ncbi:MAG: translation initiation factor IF-2 [bacterium]
MTKKTSTIGKISTGRPPIVVILGHVDHGKTTLLDYIRQTHRAASEAGGITQSIGAYQATFQDKSITFIDTPGHAAFSKMRSRGASIADVAVLVVAADDGVKPQTLESIKHLKEAAIPYVVAINKIDKPDSNPEVAKAELTQAEVFVEGYGGNVPFVLISGKTGKGIDSLLETILLLAELEEVQGDTQGALEAPIIEAHKDNHRGYIVSAIVRQGMLRIGDHIHAGTANGKLKAMYNDAGKQVLEALPGTPVQLLGWDSLPGVGEVVTSGVYVPNEEVVVATTPISQSGQHLNIILKADTRGSLEAIMGSFPAEVNIVDSSTGDINESDVLLASTTGSIILGFNSKATSSIKKLAEVEHVKILSHKIIYELLEFIEKKILRLLEPNYDEKVLGEGLILKVFEINRDKIAGVKVGSGKLETGNTIHLKHTDGTTKDARIKAMRIGKDEVKIAESGVECGILLFPNIEIREKDVIISYQKAEGELL